MISNEALEEAMKAAEESVESRLAANKGIAQEELKEETIELPNADEDSATIENLKAELAKKSQELAATKDALLRTAADFENYRKRSEKEIGEIRKFAAKQLLLDFLPVMDNFERAVEHLPADPEEPLKTMVTGIKMIKDGFLATLRRHGAEPFDSLGKTFDPNIHEALTQMPTGDYEPGQVCQVMERGYMLQDRLLRPAKVVVATAMPQAEPISADQTTKEE